MFLKCARMRDFLTGAVSVDDAHERIQSPMSMPHASCSGSGAMMMSSTCTTKLTSYVPSACFIMFTLLGVDGMLRVQRILMRPILGKVRNPPLASIRMLDLESCGFSEISGLLTIPPALEARFTCDVLLTSALISNDLGFTSIV